MQFARRDANRACFVHELLPRIGTGEIDGFLAREGDGNGRENEAENISRARRDKILPRGEEESQSVFYVCRSVVKPYEGLARHILSCPSFPIVSTALCVVAINIPRPAPCRDIALEIEIGLAADATPSTTRRLEIAF